ncbi:hypothetical protein Tco_1366062 [Tanacetum coccineum]
MKAGVFIVHPGSVAARIKERKCKTRRGSSRPPVKRKLASGSSSSHAVRAKPSASNDDAPILSISNDDEGKFLIHLVLSEGIDLLILHLSSLYVIEKMSDEDNVIKARERSREEECEDLRVKCEAAMAEMMLQSQKWADYQVTLSTLESKVDSLEAEKARLEAIKASLRKEVEELKEDRMDVVAAMKEPFNLSKAKGYRSLYKKEHTQANNDFATATFPWLDEFVADAATPIEALLSKKPPML